MNISISEIIVILLVALLVIKPEQLPEVSRFIGLSIKKIRLLVGGIKKEFNDLINAESDAKQK